MKTHHFEIRWPDDLRPQKTFPSALPDGFRPLYAGLENAWISGNSGYLALQRLSGGHIHFGHLQSSLTESRTIRIHTVIPTLFFTACHEGNPQWEFSGQPTVTHAFPGTHFAVALPPGETALRLPAGFCRLSCFIMAGFRLQLIARDHSFLQPAIAALQGGIPNGTCLLPACPTYRDVRENFDYLRSKKVESAARRNVLYKNKLHAMLACYDNQLAAQAERARYSRDRIFERALALMQHHRDEPDYGIHRLAGDLAVSARRVQYAFREQGTTFTRQWDTLQRTAGTESVLR